MRHSRIISILFIVILISTFRAQWLIYGYNYPRVVYRKINNFLK